MKTPPRYESTPFGDPLVELGQVGPPDDQDMLNASQAAEYLSVSVHKISRLVRFGRLPPYVWTVDRRHRLFDRRDLDRLRPNIVDIGNDWDGPSPENVLALDAVHARLTRRGVAPGPDGYSLLTLIAFIEERGWAWKIEKEMGPWRFNERTLPTYEAVIDRPYRAGLGGLSVTSHAWTPEIALARSLDRLLGDEEKGASILM